MKRIIKTRLSKACFLYVKLCRLFVEFVFGADFDAYAANAASADVLEVFFHVLGAFFRVEVAFAVRGGKFAVNCASGASLLANVAAAATVFNDGEFALQRTIGKYGGKADFAAVVGG